MLSMKHFRHPATFAWALMSGAGFLVLVLALSVPFASSPRPHDAHAVLHSDVETVMALRSGLASMDRALSSGVTLVPWANGCVQTAKHGESQRVRIAGVDSLVRAYRQVERDCTSVGHLGAQASERARWDATSAVVGDVYHIDVLLP